MAKALLGQYHRIDDRLVLEAARLRTRVRDLEDLVDRLKTENDRLRTVPAPRKDADGPLDEAAIEALETAALDAPVLVGPA